MIGKGERGLKVPPTPNESGVGANMGVKGELGASLTTKDCCCCCRGLRGLKEGPPPPPPIPMNAGDPAAAAAAAAAGDPALRKGERGERGESWAPLRKAGGLPPPSPGKSVGSEEVRGFFFCWLHFFFLLLPAPPSTHHRQQQHRAVDPRVAAVRVM